MEQRFPYLSVRNQQRTKDTERVRLTNLQAQTSTAQTSSTRTKAGTPLARLMASVAFLCSSCQRSVVLTCGNPRFQVDVRDDVAI